MLIAVQIGWRGHGLNGRTLKTCATATALLSLFALGITRADEAVLPNGERVQGELSSDDQGRLLFRRHGQESPVLLDKIDHIRFPSSRLSPLRAPAPSRILLRGDEHVTGELLGLDSDRVQLRTAWKERISIPRAAVSAVRHAAGFVTVFVDDFEKDLKSWQLTGMPALTTQEHASGRRSLCLNDPDQAAEYTLPTPLAAGRAGINFRDRTQAGSLRWQVEAEFAGSAGWPVVRVGLDPQASDYAGEIAGSTAAGSRLARKDGWQRLDIEFSRDMLLLSIDDMILLSCRQPGSGGALRKVRLSCGKPTRGTGERGEVFFDDFALAKAVPELPHPKGDPDQDEIWLLSGDQLFGYVVDATGGTIQLRGSFGPWSISWGEVRGIYFRRSGPRSRKPQNNTVRIWLRPGIGFESDVLEGTVRRLDAHRLILGHEFLGDLEIDRKRLLRLRMVATESIIE
jgi:hypothetical protein